MTREELSLIATEHYARCYMAGVMGDIEASTMWYLFALSAYENAKALAAIK